jgi:type 1 glutamine amidotransferase
MGVHINRCVLGRPFAIRQMVAQGQNVLLMRDLTDSMYNHLKRPYVSHFRGTELVVEHIEKFCCPSITSADFLGGEPFRFKGDVKKRIAIIIGENEYHTWETLPEFARKELEGRGYQISYVSSSPIEGDNNFTNYSAIKNADLVLVSVRRRTPPKAMMDLLHAHMNAGKPLVGIRTTSHAFAAEPQGRDFASWPQFDAEVLGAKYGNHYGNDLPTVIQLVNAAVTHPVLSGVKPAEFRVSSHLYINSNLAETCTSLLQGHVDGQSQMEPVAWVNTAQNRRVFYTSLGSQEDFKLPAFRRLLLNGVLWCLEDPVPPANAELTILTTKP